jgi:membrane protease YdiL (CAAX protease family)
MLGRTAGHILGRLAIYVVIQVAVIALTQSPTWTAVAGVVTAIPLYLMPGASPDDQRMRLPRRRTLVWWTAGLIPVWAIGQALAVWIYHTFPDAAFGYDRHVETLSLSAQTWAIITTVVMAPIIEEILMRGIMYRELRRSARLPVPLAAVISSLVFAVFHGNIVQGGAVFLLGVFLAFAYEYTHSILTPIALHALFNMLSAFVPVSLIAPLAVPSIIAVGIFAIVVSLTFVYVLRRRW